MNSNMFVSIRTDIGSDFKVRILCKQFGMEALAWWVLTLCELYNENGWLELDDELAMGVIVEKFSTTEENVARFFDRCSEIGLIDRAKWAEKRTVYSESMYSEIEYRRSRVEAGKKGGRPPKKKASEQAK